MDQSHITDEDMRAALENYRWALKDALSEAGADASREEVVAIARTILGEDEPDHLELVETLVEGDNGDSIWNLEEEVIDDEETVASGEDLD